MENEPTDQASFSSLRRWGVGLNVVLTIAAVLVLVAMVNYLAIRHFQRLEVSDHSQAKLSERTRDVLRSLTNQVKVTVYFDSEDDLFARVTTLLKEYKFNSQKISVELVDYTRDPAAAKIVKARYKLTQMNDKNLVIFDSNGKTRFVSGQEMSDYDIENIIAQKTNQVHRTHFKGELLFTSAIYSVAASRPLKAYFLRGHGEHSPDNTDAATGYSKFSAILRDESNIPFEKLTLLGAGEIPADCNLLILAGPTDPIPADELEKIQHYLEQGGRALVLFNYFSVGKKTGLEKLLAAWDVAVGDNLVVDIENSPMRSGKGVVPSDLGNHPIVRSLQNSQLYLIMPRSISKAKGGPTRADAPKIEELLMTGPNSIIVTDFRKGVPQTNPTLDQRGSVPLLVAVEKGGIPGVATERGTTRLAVVGDSFFLQNDGIESVANRDLAAHLASWLVDQNVLLRGLAPRPITTYKLTMTPKEFLAVRWLLLLGMPGGVLLAGLLVWLRRRS